MVLGRTKCFVSLFTSWCDVILQGGLGNDLKFTHSPTHSIVTYTFQAGLRTLHGLGPQLRRAISGPLGSDDDELFLKEDDSQKAQVIKRQLIISFFNCNEISYSCFRQ